MWGTVELPDVHDVALVLENGRFVIIHVEIIGGREDGHDGGKTCALRFTVHAVTAYVSDIGVQLGDMKSHPASCASCARMMERRLLRSRN